MRTITIAVSIKYLKLCSNGLILYCANLKVKRQPCNSPGWLCMPLQFALLCYLLLASEYSLFYSRARWSAWFLLCCFSAPSNCPFPVPFRLRPSSRAEGHFPVVRLHFETISSTSFPFDLPRNGLHFGEYNPFVLPPMFRLAFRFHKPQLPFPGMLKS